MSEDAQMIEWEDVGVSWKAEIGLPDGRSMTLFVVQPGRRLAGAVSLVIPGSFAVDAVTQMDSGAFYSGRETHARMVRT